MGTPEVSVILPTYNRLPLLRRAVASVFAQTFCDWELIVVDDGSTDDTPAYLETIDDPRVRSLGLENSGVTSARNAGLRLARAEWVAFHDSDDLWLPEKLEWQLQRVTAQPACRWSYTRYSFIDTNGTPLPGRSSLLPPPVSGHILEPLLRFEVSTAVPTMLVQRSLIEEIGGFDATMQFLSDYDFILRVAARSEVCALSETLTLVREHPGRTTARLRPADLHADQARSFRKAAAAAVNHRIRALCLRQCASQLVGQANALSREGSHRAAFATLARAARLAPLHKSLWRAAARCTVRVMGWR
ncbi:MAG TPA: glycosyltransferase family A protein [Rhodanobacteraceae bacterium]|jgi:glycosyltransferase involved in cell wall biosynthesis|nr:glycosyltransferase family A protein [Rhodanobacteraceae bacterium]